MRGYENRERPADGPADPVRRLSPSSAQRAPLPKSPRLYVFDCGRLEGGDVSRFRLTRQEMATTDMSVACYLVAHPKGTLIWDAGAVPDADIDASPAGSEAKRYRIVLPNNAERFVTSARTLKSQLAAAGYAPADITYLALSHYHYDHTANANLFAASTWLVRPVERDAMFAAKPPDLLQPSTYSALRNSKTIAITHGRPRRVRRRHRGAEVVARSHAGASGAVS